MDNFCEGYKTPVTYVLIFKAWYGNPRVIWNGEENADTRSLVLVCESDK